MVSLCRVACAWHTHGVRSPLHLRVIAHAHDHDIDPLLPFVVYDLVNNGVTAIVKNSDGPLYCR